MGRDPDGGGAQLPRRDGRHRGREDGRQRHRRRARVGPLFRRTQLLSAAFMAFSHGGNDAQKTMGIITLALVSGGLLAKFHVPTWVIALSASAMAAGTLAGGRRIIHTMGNRLVA